MTTEANGRQVVDVTRDLLADNDDAVGGRLPLLVACGPCGDQEPRQIGTLGAGRWSIDHLHDRGWAVHRLGVPAQTVAPRPPNDVAALAAALSSAFAGASR